MTILELLAEHGKIKSFSEGRRLISLGAIKVRRNNLDVPELITWGFHLLSGDVVLIGSHQTIVVP